MSVAGVVGRDRGMAAMGAFLDALPSGPCGLVLEGPEGIGKTTVWRAGAAWAAGRSFTVLSCRELQTGRRAEYQASEQRAGIVKEAWYLARTPAGDQLIAYLESPDFAAARATFSQSGDEFDQWFKRCLADATGLDLNTPPTAPLPQLLSSYPADGRR